MRERDWGGHMHMRGGSRQADGLGEKRSVAFVSRSEPSNVNEGRSAATPAPATVGSQSRLPSCRRAD